MFFSVSFSTLLFQETDLQREARMSAIQAIRSISNWLYWQSPVAGGGGGGGSTPVSLQNNLTYVSRNKSSEPSMDKLREAVAARKRAGGTIGRISSNNIYHEDYWIPTIHALPASTQVVSYNASTTQKSSSPTKEYKDRNYRVDDDNQKKPVIWGVLPMVTATIASVVVWLQVGEGTVGGLKQHIGGSLALDIVNSSWSQVMLAGITWYIIGIVIIELVEVVQSRRRL